MRAEQPLLALLHSNDYTVREEVVRTLGAMGSCGAVEGIRVLLASGLEGAGAEQPASPLAQRTPVKRCWKPSVTLVMAAAATSP